MFCFHVLGPLEVTRDGVAVEIPSRRQRALVARLLLGAGHVVSVEALAAALWEDDPPRDARHALQTYVSRLRVWLGPLLVTRAPGYLLAVDQDAVDARQFETGAARAAELIPDDPGTAVTLLDELLALWRGSAYEEFADSFAQAAAVRLEELRLVARESQAEALIGVNDLDRAIGELGELVADQPLRERPHAQLMRALYLAGRQSDALGTFSRFRERMRDELGVDPSPLLRQTHEDVLRHTVARPTAAEDQRPPSAGSGARSAPPVRVMAQPAGPPPVAASATSLVGRADDVRELRTLLGANRLVTLVGPGGVGKTRLAQEMALRLGDSETPVWWVDLGPAGEPDDVRYRLVNALGIPEPAEERVDDFLVRTLRTVQALIIVDNCEHVIDAVAALLSRIVVYCADIVTLATSREPLGVPGEHVRHLAPLPTLERAGLDESRRSPAVELFEARYRASGGLRLDAGERRVVAELCHRLDGLPLAIELAAARARSLGIAAVAERPPLDLLAGVRHTGDARHRSLRAVVDWSHDLLEPHERILFRRLAVFSGPFTVDDVEYVCVDGTLGRRDVASSLAGLVDKSMVAGPEGGRCRLLDTMRGYAAEQLVEHGEDRWIGAAHARHFVSFAEQAGRDMVSPREAEWSAAVAERIDELRVAHRWGCAHDADLAIRLSAALAQYASYHMRFELQDWAEAAADLPGAERHPLRATVLGSAASGAWSRGDFGKAEKLARRGIAAAPDGDEALAAGPMLALGDVSSLAGRVAEASQAYQAAQRYAGDAVPYIACEALGGQAITLSYQGDVALATDLAEAGVRRARDTGAPGLIAISLYFAAECRLDHEPAVALELLDEARRLAASVGAVFALGVATLSTASLRARSGADVEETLAAFGEAIEHWRGVGNRTQQWVTLRNLVPVLVRAGRDDLACAIERALRAAPVQLPVDVPVPEADALVEAVTMARLRLGDAAVRAAEQWGARATLDDLTSSVLALVDGHEHGRDNVAGAGHAGSSR